MTELIRITTRLELQTIECCDCGIIFAMPEEFYKVRLSRKDSFYCPAGHSQHFTGKTHEQQLREAEAHARDLSISNTRLTDDNLDLAKRNKGLRTKNTDLRKRAKNGTCGFCKRTFKNVQKHVEDQHPGMKV